MKTCNSKIKAPAFLGAAFMLLIALIFTACPQKVKPKAEEPPAPPKHAITFSVDSTTPNGILKAKAEGITETGTSPINVEEGKAVIFTATADAGYRVKGWTLDGNAVNGTAETYTHTVTKTTTVSVSFEVASVEGGAVLILSPDKLTINVEAKTEDGSAITVEGCTVTTLASEAETTLTATGSVVTLKGKITKLVCYDNKLTALNVQGLTALQELWCSSNQLPELNVQGLTALQTLKCYNNQLTALNVQGLTALQKLLCGRNKLTALNMQGCTALKVLSYSYNQLTALNVQGLTSLKDVYCYSNQLNAQVMTELLNALPVREESDDAKAILYTEKTGETEGNHKDYNTPADLKKAFEDAKKRNWTLQKRNASGGFVEI